MRTRKSVAALAIATAATVGVGVVGTGTAAATDSGSDSATSVGGSWYQVWANGNLWGVHVNVGHTDERFVLAAGDVCGNHWPPTAQATTWNDVNDPWLNNYSGGFSCDVAWMSLYPTDGGIQDGRTVTR
ncbi:hypothetical protein ACFVSN_30885 [Kitasatospora sp. NPDC057904]|uniref:hypothetical protein n=1 Tax=Kitasatospora sp. NPDC057904 TaxID=3346275 RepID=UPI0036DDE6CF